MDIGGLPYLRKVENSELTHEQNTPDGLFWCKDTSRPTLISSHENGHKRVDFVYALMQLLIESSFEIKGKFMQI